MAAQAEKEVIEAAERERRQAQREAERVFDSDEAHKIQAFEAKLSPSNATPFDDDVMRHAVLRDSTPSASANQQPADGVPTSSDQVAGGRVYVSPFHKTDKNSQGG